MNESHNWAVTNVTVIMLLQQLEGNANVESHTIPIYFKGG